MSTIRVSDKTHRALHTLARASGASMNDVVEQAIELYRRVQILEAANAAYAAMRNDPLSWQEALDDDAVWENTVADGLEDD